MIVQGINIKFDGGKYSLTSEPLNYIVKQHAKKSSRVIGYYSKIEDALNDLFDKMLQDSSCKSVSALQKQMKIIRDDIKKAAATMEK